MRLGNSNSLMLSKSELVSELFPLQLFDCSPSDSSFDLVVNRHVTFHLGVMDNIQVIKDFSLY